ncbi:unnamed protein product [Pylaiella littoralis]
MPLTIGSPSPALSGRCGHGFRVRWGAKFQEKASAQEGRIIHLYVLLKQKHNSLCRHCKCKASPEPASLSAVKTLLIVVLVGITRDKNEKTAARVQSLNRDGL